MFLSSMGQGIQIWLILMTFICGGIMAAGSPEQKEVFKEIIKFPVYGREDLPYKGLFFTKVSLGNPPQELNVMIDTSSDEFWVNCPSNETMGSYNIKLSTTASLVPCPQVKNTKCPFNVNNYGRSVSGLYVRDVLHYESFSSNLFANPSTYVIFGCASNRNTLMNNYPKVEGVLGLGSGPGSFLSYLVSQRIVPPVFSHCLPSKGYGFLILGEVLDRGVAYTPTVSSMYQLNHYRIEYKVNLDSFAVNEELIPIRERVFHKIRGTLIDTGRQRSVLEAEIYDSLVNAVSGFVNKSSYLDPNDYCYYVSPREKYPKLHFKFHGGASLNVNPADYLDILGPNGYCITFLRREDKSISGEDKSIFGAPMMMDKLMIYDITHGQIGWTEHDCSKPVNVSFVYDVGSQATSCSWKTSIFATTMLVYWVLALL